ncbi:MAG: hypothetical protein WD995_03095 [Gemmatimonadota bacterium]
MERQRAGTTSRRSPVPTLFWSAVWLLSGAGAAAAQSMPSEAPVYVDAGASLLHGAAMRHHASHVDRLRAYEAVVRQRVGVALRTPLRDRTVYRAESAHRVFWRSDGPPSIEVLGLREQAGRGVEAQHFDQGFVDHVFEPDRDRLMFGRTELESDSDPGDFRVLHPLEADGAGVYAFASGDTVTLALPDGRRVTAVELRVSPRTRHPTKITGSLWIEPETGALVRATYRLSESLDLVRDIEDMRDEDARGEFRWVPGIFKPWTFELSLITVDYALWDGAVWLPRRWRGEGLAVAGILRIPAEFDRSYRFTRVATEGASDEVVRDVASFDPAESRMGIPYRRIVDEKGGGADSLLLFVPADLGRLARSRDLPPPVWSDAPGFFAGEEVAEELRRLDQIPTGGPESMPRWFRWGFQRPDLVRYNRVEEFSVGARGAVLPELFGRPLSLTGTLRVGTGDRHPNIRLDAERTTLRRTVSLSAYHELAGTDEGARHLGLGNSLLAALAGRDDGDYYRRSGAALIWTPAPATRQWYRVSVHSEYHEAVAGRTRLALPRVWKDDGWAFRPNLTAEEGWEHALGIHLSPSWGTDPARTHAGLEATGMVSFGDLEHAIASLTGRFVLPLPGDLRMGLLAGGGVATSDVSPQRALSVGGPRTLRGYAPRTLVGPCQARTRVEVQRAFSFGGISVFSDAAWAGACDALTPSAAMRSAGLGLSLVDGLLRFDLARGFDGPASTRLDVYLDGLL